MRLDHTAAGLFPIAPTPFLEVDDAEWERLFAVGDTSPGDGLLACLGTVRPVGERLGDGQAIKVVNQHLASIHLVAAAEVLALTARLGLDAAAVLALVESGAADAASSAGGKTAGGPTPSMLL